MPKIVVVTGGGAGVGRAVANEFALRGGIPPRQPRKPQRLVIERWPVEGS